MGLIEKGDAVEDTKGEIPMERSEEAGSPKVILSSCTSSSWESNCPAENGSE